MIVKEVIWFSGRDCIGIVVTENDMGETKFYIGKGSGHNADVDARSIANWGIRIDIDYLNRFIERNKKQ